MNVPHFVRLARRQHRRRTALIFGSESVSVDEVVARSYRIANGLLGLGIRPGSRIGVVLPNCVQSMEIELGCACAGIVRVSLNHRSTERTLRSALEKMDVSGLVYDAEHAELATWLFELDREQVMVEVPKRDGAGPQGPGQSYAAVLARGSDRSPDVTLSADTPYCLFCTSGTTGDPKGVIHTHRSQLAVAAGLLLEFGPVAPGERILLPQPLSHGGGFFMLPYLLSGATCVVMERFDPEEAMRTASHHRVETLKLVPTMLVQMLRSGSRATDSYHPQKIIYGAAPMPRDWLLQALDAFGPVLWQLYGQAEAPMCITVLSALDHREAELLASSGRPWRNVEVRVLNEGGAEVGVGEVGEVTVSGDHVMQGYWDEPEATAAVLRDDTLHTRDMASVDERGYIYLQGRKDEMIISGGYNIGPRAVEQALIDHPAVLDAAVVGVPDTEWGEVVKAFVVTDGADLTAGELIEFCKPRLGYERPRAVEIVEELPRNAYGKIDRDALTTRGIGHGH